MNTLNKIARSRRTLSRDGAAAVECAIVAPILTLLLLGSIDVGQFANVHQKISDASREGARVAARYDTQTTTEVETAVMNYLEEASPGVSPATLAAATVVRVSDSTGTTIPAGNLTSVATGSQLRVQVTLQFDPVRWISGFDGLDGQQITATTMMRRE